MTGGPDTTNGTKLINGTCEEDAMRKTYNTPELIDRGSATARTLEGIVNPDEPETGQQDKAATL